MIFSLPILAALSLANPQPLPVCSDTIAAKLRSQLTPVLEKSAAEGKFSGVVVVACNGAPMYSVTYGMANRANSVPNTLDTRFNLGSMNKMWTAIAIAQLVEQGKVDLDAPVGRYLPDLTNTAVRDKVLVKHLLSHTSGLGSYFTRGYLRNHVAITKASDLLPFFIDDSLSFAPGARFQYSNAGFALLGMIVERVSGMNYFDYMRTNVLARAGMSPDAFVTLPIPAKGFATGYVIPPESTDSVINDNFLERSSSPAGGAYASAADIIAFSRALWSGKLVGAAIVNNFTTGKVDMGPIRYAYGFGASISNGWRGVGHNGGAPGVGTDFISFPDQGIDAVVLTNIDMPAAGNVMGRIVSILTGAPLMQMVEPSNGAPPP